MDSQSVAVTIPVHRNHLDELEVLSLLRCVEVLGHHRLIFVGPESLDFEAYLGRSRGASVERFPDHYFKSIIGYNKLMLSREFYSRFSGFSYILKYELDAFVFHDDLAHWCGQGFDYVGAPWLDESRDRWFGVGNGGFCLRSVEGCLAVLDSQRKEDAADYWRYIRSAVPGIGKRAVRYPWKIACHLGLGHTSGSYLRRLTGRLDRGLCEDGFWGSYAQRLYRGTRVTSTGQADKSFLMARGLADDLFWGLHAQRFCPEFRVAPFEEAIKFSVEGGLVRAWNEGRFGDRPPFGCHRSWYLRWIHRYLHGSEPAESESEAIVWNWAAMAGMERAAVAGS